MYHQNVQSLINKIDVMDAFLDSDPVDFACLTEHWLGGSGMAGVRLSGYNVVSYYCRSNYSNGGVVIFVNKRICSFVKPLLGLDRFCTDKIFEVCGALLGLCDKKVCILCIYRSPDGVVDSFLERLDLLLDFVCTKQCNNIILCGDLNIDRLTPTAATNALMDILAAFNVVPLVNEPTRITARSATGVDYMCTSMVDPGNISCGVVHNGIADHSAQFLTYNSFNKPSCDYIYRRIYSSDNYAKFMYYLSKEDWSDIYGCDSVNRGFSQLMRVMHYYVDLAFPVMKIKISADRVKCLWMTPGIRVSSGNMRRLYEVAVHSRDRSDFEYYNRYKAVYKRVVTCAKMLYNRDLYLRSDNKSKAVWRIISDNIGNNKNRNSIDGVTVNSRFVTDPGLIAEEFSSRLYEVPMGLRDRLGLADSVTLLAMNKQFPTIFLTPVTPDCVYDVIRQLKCSNSSGMDNVSANILKSSAIYIVDLLSFLMNLSITEGVFPDVLKTARVVPIYKKGDSADFNSYRPVSLLPSVSKVFEKLMLQKFFSFVERNETISTVQHGFIGGRSTTSAILHFLSCLYDNMDRRCKCIGIFLDLSKAFDLVDHSRLLYKLAAYGFRGTAYKWLKSYLADRSQLVDIGGVLSSPRSVQCGVPQGSVLGPFLFLLFVNDLPAAFESQGLTMFADDNCYLCKSDSVREVRAEAQRMLNKFYSWFKENKLILNKEKTVFMKFSARVTPINESLLLKIDNRSIQQVHGTKFLGVYLDENLRWNLQVDSLAGRLSSVCFALFMLRPKVQRYILISYYHAMFVSRAVYGIIFWGASAHMSRIFRIQKKAIRNILGLSARESCRDYFRMLKLLTLPSLYIREVLIVIYRSLGAFARNSDIHSYYTRGGDNLLLPRHNLSLTERNPLYAGIKFYNYLADDIKSAPNVNTFKKLVTSLLIDKELYTIDDFYLV